MRELSGIGRLGEFIGRPAIILAFVLQFGLVVGVAAYYHGRDTSEGCLYCHADKARMDREGWPQFYFTQAQVEKESKMPGVTCTDCHLGDGTTHDKERGHAGMLKLLLVDKNGAVAGRKGRLDRLVPTGENRMNSMLPKVDGDGGGAPDPDIFTVLWHDRDAYTLGYDPGIARKTCGKKGCHPAEVEQFKATIMGGNLRQRSMRHWTDVHGPNNCGPSFADLPAGTGAASGYSFANYEIIKSGLSCPSSYRDATDRQRFCNVCHAGCLDCHYYPSEKGGVHAFTRRIPATNCSGGGRGTGMCHSGSMERRRGDSYLGAKFSQPAGAATDAHYKAGMECVDCHETGEKGMGDMQRQVDCAGCHYFACKANGSGVHRRLRCQACHTGSLGGYEMTVWGMGEVVKGRKSPFKKYSLYYGNMEPPILIRDREGLYTPFKLWPNIATNVKRPEPRHKGIEWRWPAGETRDAYAFLGTYDKLPGANLALAWIQLEAVGHPLGKSRSCASCHGSTTQKAHAEWEYLNYAGSGPFTGSQDIVADGEGLRIVNIRKKTGPRLLGDANLYDFAAWMYLGDIWRVEGDFSIPKADGKKYQAYVKDEAAFKGRLAALEARLGGLDKDSAGYGELERKMKKARAIGEHDPAAGLTYLSPPPSGGRVSPSMPR